MTSDKRYLWINVDGRPVSVHRQMYLDYGPLRPTDDVDHINRVRKDNRRCNLRRVTRAQNLQNSEMHKDNHTGFKGVARNGTGFIARLMVDGKQHRLGTFRSPGLAFAAYVAASIRLQTHSPYQ